MSISKVVFVVLLSVAALTLIGLGVVVAQPDIDGYWFAGLGGVLLVTCAGLRITYTCFPLATQLTMRVKRDPDVDGLYEASVDTINCTETGTTVEHALAKATRRLLGKSSACPDGEMVDWAYKHAIVIVDLRGKD